MIRVAFVSCLMTKADRSLLALELFTSPLISSRYVSAPWSSFLRLSRIFFSIV